MKRFMYALLSVVAYLYSTNSLYGKVAIGDYLWMSGYTSLDTAWDTRQTNLYREGLDIIWPLREQLDPLGADINDQGRFNMLPLRTRMILEATTPSWYDTQNDMVIDADFVGNTGEVFSVFRIRYAYAHFLWGHYRLIIGRYNHPLYIVGCRPNMVSYLNGTPIDTQIEIPQIRFGLLSSSDEEPEHELLGICANQTAGLFSAGPDGPSADYTRNAIMPILHAQYRLRWGRHLFGIDGGGKRLIPRLASEAGFRENTSLTTGVATVFAAFDFDDWRLLTKFIYTENDESHLLPDGYAVQTKDPITKVQTYTPLRGISYWVDMDIHPNTTLVPGFFAGVYKTRGTPEPAFFDPATNQPIVFGGEPDIDYIIRIAPRVWWYCDPVTVGAELQVTHTGFGDELDTFLRPQNVSSVTNVRFLIGFYYSF